MPECSKRAKAPISSLRLLVPPLRLLSASLWQVAEQRLIKYYTRLEEFVSVVLEMVPDLLSARKRIELLLGLRARFVLELCHDQPSVTLQMLQPHLDRICCIAESAPIDKSGDHQTIEAAVGNFVRLIQNLLQNPTYRELFFQHIYSLHYGPKYDKALQSLVWEFLSRLETFIPVPSFHQAASWFEEDLSPLEDTLQLIYDTKEIHNLLFHFKHSAHLDTGSSSPPISANTILSILSISVTIKTVVIPRRQADLSTPHLIRRSMNETSSNGDRKDKASCEDAEEDQQGGEDENGPRPGGKLGLRPGDLDQGKKTNTKEMHWNSQDVNNEADGHTTDCENPVGNSIEREAPASSVEDPGLSPLQGRLSETVSQPVNTVDNSASQPPLGKTSPQLTRQMKRDTEEKGAAVKGKVDAGLSEQPNNTAIKENSRYTCSVCGKAFYYRKFLTQHQKIHTEERSVVCSLCGKVFRNKGHWNDHVCLHTLKTPCEETEESSLSSKSGVDTKLLSHQPDSTAVSEELRYKCSECGKAFFYKKFLTQHQKNHSVVRPQVCSYWGKGLRNKGRLNDHVYLRTGERPFVCSVCGRTFAKSYSLDQHKQMHTGQRPVKGSSEREVVALSDEGPHSNVNEVMTSESTDHMTENEHPVSNSNEQEAPPSSGEGPGVSPLQGQTKVSLKTRDDTIGSSEHQSTHTVERPNLSTFRQKANLNEHMSLHTKKRAFDCEVCGKTFIKSSYLLQHKRLHTGERPYLCSYCGKTYAFKSSLLNHRCVYQGQLPYSCSICGKRFSQSSSVAPHERLHTGERPFLCSTCGKGFTTSGALIVHTRRHTGERPYKCEVCGKGYVQSGHLVDHRRVHTGEKPYSCPVCKHQFKIRHHLKRHIKTHTGEKPHECLKCGKKFARKSHVREHQRVHK